MRKKSAAAQISCLFLLCVLACGTRIPAWMQSEALPAPLCSNSSSSHHAQSTPRYLTLPRKICTCTTEEPKNCRMKSASVVVCRLCVCVHLCIYTHTYGRIYVHCVCVVVELRKCSGHNSAEIACVFPEVFTACMHSIA